ncbi:hypothetical protein LB526_20095 [Mesorhizobium sp. CA6]|uniref:hypothetical protein n=1 Tax=Mesorhizobium sp. CA6 TaxID=588500 RepID=UPI001CC96BD7|nr:hypothetical protein [Mesorhizobium sp. CA6]MBZ9769063.1 hypothetical protein [Mesorhizobium sp. CA6]
MTLNELSWSPSEKKVARAAYDKAFERALASIMAEFKRRANAATTPSEMWEVEDYLKEQRRDLDRTFDYRYSQLTVVFATLIRQGYLDEDLLSGLSEEKREEIRRMLAWHKG